VTARRAADVAAPPHVEGQPDVSLSGVERTYRMAGSPVHAIRGVDLLVQQNRCIRLSADRIPARDAHGSGCTLSSAIAAGLAKGMELADAVSSAKDFVTAALAAADRIRIGSGRGPLHHFHASW